MDDFSYYESEIGEELYGDFDGGEDVLMEEEEALHNEVIGDLEPLFDHNGPPPLSLIANDSNENEIITNHNEPN